MSAHDSYEVWTDGGCRAAHDLAPGGWAWCLVHAHDDANLLANGSGHERGTTSNRMELTAALMALRWLEGNPREQGAHILLYSDSTYMVDGITRWIYGWRRNGWRLSTGQEVKNRDLWEQIDDLRMVVPVGWRWVRGHNGEVLNDLVDRVCTQEMNQLLTRAGRND